MRILRRITLSSAPFYASLVVVTSLAVFIGVFWAINEYQAYQESIENIRYTYRHQYETRLQEELSKVVKLIDFRRQQSEEQVELDIRARVQSAYTIASHHYRLYKNEKSAEQLRSMIIELLRPIRWNNGRGYYFAGRVDDGIVDLFADEPYFEGKNAGDFQQAAGRDVIGDIIRIVRDKEAGLYHYNLIKPEFPGQSFPKIVFVKYFPPLDWFIGAGIYNDDLEETLQHEVLERVRSIQFGNGGELFCFRGDGTIISDPDQRQIGRSVKDLVDSEGLQYGEAFLKSATLPGGEFIHFSDKKEETGTYHQKLSFIQPYRDWDWVLGAAMFMDAMEQTIVGETETYQRISFRNVFAFIILFAIAVAFLLLSTFFYSVRIMQEISLFTNFFREAADSNVKISKQELMFREFEDLAVLANRMVDERIKSELLLHRDELRLDTLLRLGMMDKHSLQDKYDFVLRRIVQITRSEEGYLALVNDGQTHISVCSFIVFDDKDIALRQGEFALPRSLAMGGLPGRTVRGKRAVIVNRFDGSHKKSEFPYRIALRRHLDVPVYNDGRIVAVAGVCNNSDNYDNSDIRQMTMLLEGMWMHVLKKVSEEELATLERQIIAVSENERSTIGRILHDDLGSHLTGVELLSKVLQQQLREDAPGREKQLGTIRDLIRDAIEKTRHLSQGLYPVHVVEYGLEAAIEELVVEVQKVFDIHLNLFWQGDGDTFGEITATHLYYIIREAVFNAARHGKPQNIEVHVRLDMGNFNVTIVDDGLGLGSRANGKGMGFHTMKYRAKAIGAELTIGSGKEKGTVVTVVGEGQG